MKKIYLLLILLLLPICCYSLEYPQVNSKYVEIYDLDDDKILYELDSNNKASIASLTKIATTITAIENITNLDEIVTITDDILKTVRWDASIAGLKVGDKVTYRDLLFASMLPSGADATNSLAILLTGSIDNFVNKMNDLAKRINLENTHFVNVTGLDDKDHYSTSDDVRKLLVYSLKNPLFREIYTTKEYQLSNGLKVKSTLFTYNKSSSIDIDVQEILGSKTGFTLDAGYCLSTLVNINGHEIISIVLKAEKKDNSFYNIVDTNKLIKFLNDNYKDEILVKKDQLIKTIPVNLSKIDSYEIRSSEEIKKFLPSDYDIKDLRIEYEGKNELDFKDHENDKIGVINYFFGDELLITEDVILSRKIDIDFVKVLKKYYLLILLVIFILVFLLITTKKKTAKKKKYKKK